MGCGTKMSKFLRRMNALSWIRKCRPFRQSSISLSLSLQRNSLVLKSWITLHTSCLVLITLQSFLYAKWCFSLLSWSISIFLQNKRRPTALRSQRWAKGSCHPACLSSCWIPYQQGLFCFCFTPTLDPLSSRPLSFLFCSNAAPHRFFRLLGRSSLLCCMTLTTAS